MVPYRSIHFVGVLTADMASLALYALKLGLRVVGSDDHRDTLYAPVLEVSGVTFFDMFAQTNIQRGTDLVVISPYYDDRHPEVLAAEREKIPVMTAVAFTQLISESKQRIAILSEYEGPLVSTFLHHVWNQGHIPTGGLLKTVSTTTPSLADTRESDIFLHPLSGFKRDCQTYEADFLSFEASTVIIPSIFYDFPELYTTLDDVYQAYYTLVKRVPRKGLIIGNSDWSRMKRLRSHLADRHIETYGLERDAMWHIREVVQHEQSTEFTMMHANRTYGPFVVPYLGMPFVYAAAAVVVASLLNDMKIETLAKGLETLPKLRRYFETHIDREGRVLIDDQADHPEMIYQVLETVKQRYPGKRIWCLYQPGSYLRTKNYSTDLIEALHLADFVYLGDIKGYPKEKSEGLHMRHFIASMKQHHPQTYYMEEAMDMTGLLSDRVASTDCIVTLGAEGMCQRIVAPLHVQES